MRSPLAQQALDKVLKTMSKRQPTRIPFELIEDKLHEYFGNISAVATDLQINHLDLCTFIDKHYELRDICLSYRTSLLDQAEENIRLDLLAGSFKATKFVLQTLGRKRGYAPMIEDEQLPEGNKKKIDLTKYTPDQLKKMRDILDMKTVEGDFSPLPSDD